VHVRDESVAGFGDQIVCGELMAIEDGERLAGKVDHDGVFSDGCYLAEHLFADV
jgi:hypothetical protein